MEPIRPNNYIFEKNFLQDLPSDTLGDICSFLSIEHLGNLSSLSTSFASSELNDVTWKSLDPNSLPEAYQKLPGSILKEKLKGYYQALKAKVDLVLENADRTAVLWGVLKRRLFSEKLITQLKKDNLSLMAKGTAIETDPDLEWFLFDLYNYLSVQSITEVTEDNLKAFELLIKVVGVNRSSTKRLLVQALIGEKIELAKKLIDAGIEMNMHTIEGLSTEESIKKSCADYDMPFPQTAFDILEAYAKQKKADANNN